MFENPMANKLPGVILYGFELYCIVLYPLALRCSPVSKAYPFMVSFAVLQLIAPGTYFGEEINVKIFIGTLFILI